MGKPTTQSKVNRIHHLHAQGTNSVIIGQLFDVAPNTVTHILKHRPPSAELETFECDWCKIGVGVNRVRTVKHCGIPRVCPAGEYQFCPDCHKKLFIDKNISIVRRRFPGIY